MYIKTPGAGQWVVYCIKIGEYIYYGSTNNYKTRISQHKTQIAKIIKSGKSIHSTYRLFDQQLLTHNKAFFEIIELCEERQQASTLERQYIKTMINDVKLLNQRY